MMSCQAQFLNCSLFNAGKFWGGPGEFAFCSQEILAKMNHDNERWPHSKSCCFQLRIECKTVQSFPKTLLLPFLALCSIKKGAIAASHGLFLREPFWCCAVSFKGEMVLLSRLQSDPSPANSTTLPWLYNTVFSPDHAIICAVLRTYIREFLLALEGLSCLGSLNSVRFCPRCQTLWSRPVCCFQTVSSGGDKYSVPHFLSLVKELTPFLSSQT